MRRVRACLHGTHHQQHVQGYPQKYSYYGCIANRAERGVGATPHFAPHAPAPWLEDLVWADVRIFLEHPGEVLERVREQLGDERHDAVGLAARREDLAKRLAAKQSEYRTGMSGYTREGTCPTRS